MTERDFSSVNKNRHFAEMEAKGDPKILDKTVHTLGQQSRQQGGCHQFSQRFHAGESEERPFELAGTCFISNVQLCTHSRELVHPCMFGDKMTLKMSGLMICVNNIAIALCRE